MDAFDVNLLSQVKALNQKMSISQERLHLKRKAINRDKGKGNNPGRKTAPNAGHYFMRANMKSHQPGKAMKAQ
jgi:hypothetical protein